MGKLKLIFLIGLISFVGNARAAVSPLSVGILPPVQFPPDDFTVAGARISALWGEHRNVYGFDFAGIGNISEVSFTGLAVSGVFNMTHGQTTIVGLQLAGFTNINTQKTTVVGLQVAAGVNSNSAESSINGLQIAALANLSGHTVVRGAQIGIYNKAQDVYGFQIGVVNSTTSLHGLQIGLLNFNEKGTFVVSPILNAGF